MSTLENKPYVIDPEPLMKATHAVFVVIAVFVVTNLVTAILISFTNLHIAGLIVYPLFYCLPVLIWAFGRNYPIRQLVRWENFTRVGIHVITFFSTLNILYLNSQILELIDKLFPSTEETFEWQRQLLDSQEKFPLWIVIMSAVVLPALCEEFLFRGVIQPAIIKKTGKVLGIVTTAVLFAAAHVNLTTFVPLFLLGLFLGVLAFQSGTFLYSSVAHALVNGAALLATRLISQNQLATDTISQKSMTAETTDSTLLLMLISIGVLVFLILLLYQITPKRRVGEPDMYYI